MATQPPQTDAFEMKSLHRSTLVAGLIAILCAGLLWAGYDWFQSRYLRPFSDQAAFFNGDTLGLPSELAGPGRVRVVHFWDPACPCNVGNQQHLVELIEHFGGLGGVDFYAVQKTGSHGQLPSTLSVIKPLTHLQGAENISVSPAVAIWDREGKLAYFGPYSEGLTCNSSNSFIEPILQALTVGRTVDATHTMAVGCYCGWNAAPL